MKTHKLNKHNLTKLLIKLQNHGDVWTNTMATKAIKQFDLQKVHKKLTK